MDTNSPKPGQTGNPEAESLQLAHEWLDREGGQQRNARILQQFVDMTLTAISRGEDPPETDTTTLRALLQKLEEAGDGTSKAFRASELGNWWGSRQEQLRQRCAQAGCALTPYLVVKKGGGRGLPSRLSFEFRPALEAEPGEEATRPEVDPTLVHYQMDPVRPALWLRLLVGSRPFPVQSWRGYVLIGTAALNMALIGLVWYALISSWDRGGPVTTLTLAQLVVVMLVTAGLWWVSRPVFLLPTHRVTMAGPTFLALSELYGQLRTMPAAGRKLRSREFAVVRHWGTCPICSAEVDLDHGRVAFPDRLVGRCHDAPLEHVFSFDPVRLIGKPLLESMEVPERNV